MRKLLFILPIVLLLSCQSNEERIKGHWHSLDNEIKGMYSTYDFEDSSILFLNKNNISISDRGYYWVSGDTLEIGEHCGADYTCNFDSDTLRFYKGGERWLRVNCTPEDMVKDFFACSRFDLELDTLETVNGANLDSAIRDITIGKLKKGYRNKHNFLHEKDSFAVQLGDKFSKLNEIDDYFAINSEIYEPDASGFSCILTIDKNTHNWMIDSTINMIRRHKIIDKIYKTCINKETGSIGLVKINN